jgi:hypothetical protein
VVIFPTGGNKSTSKNNNHSLSSDPTTGMTLRKNEALLYKGYTNKSPKATAELYN